MRLTRLRAEHVRRSGRNRARRSIRQHNIQHQLALQPAEAPGQQDSTAQRMTARRHPHLARQNLAKMLQCGRGYDKLWKVAHALHAEGSPEAEAFVKARTERILCGMTGQVVKGLRQIVTKRRIAGVKAKTIHGVCDYLYRNRERMRYDEYLRNGWPIASGTVEGACKNLIRDRFERSGMRWTPQTAEALLKLRATHLSGDLDDYWEHHITHDQQRLYRRDAWQPTPSS